MHIWNRRHPANELAHPAHPAYPGDPGNPGNPGNRVHTALIKCFCFKITDTAIFALYDFSKDHFVSIKCKGIKSRIVLYYMHGPSIRILIRPSGSFGVDPDASIA